VSAKRVIANLKRSEFKKFHASSIDQNLCDGVLVRIACQDLDDNPIKPRLRELQHLGTYATSYRYTTLTGRIPAEPPAQDVEATAKNIEATLLEVAAQFGVDLDAIDPREGASTVENRGRAECTPRASRCRRRTALTPPGGSLVPGAPGGTGTLALRRDTSARGGSWPKMSAWMLRAKAHT
jgi:hypothetical protein